MLIRIFLAFVMLAVAACAPLPPMQRTGLPVELRPSGNFNERRPNFVILHYTGAANAGHALRTQTDPLSMVSAHYLIGRDGRIYALVDEHARAWHAGVSGWGGNRDVNSASIGIELDNDGADPAAAIGAFKLHFAPDGDPRQLTDEDRALLYCLLSKKREGE